MRTVLELQEERANLEAEKDKFFSRWEEDKALEFTEEDEATANDYKQKIDEFDRQIRRAEILENEMKRKADRKAVTQRRGTPEQQVVQRYSLIKAIRSQYDHNVKFDGLELEMHQEAVREARLSGIDIANVGIPSLFFTPTEQRDLIAGTTTAGGHTVQTDVQQIIPYLRIALRVEGLGAQVLRGLQGDLAFPRRDNSPASAWEGEQDTTAEMAPTFDNFTLTPNRNAGFINFSKQLMIQGNFSVEALVRDELAFQIAKAVDIAAINGSGAGNQPTGILNVSGIGDVDHGANGGAPTWAKVLEFQSDLEVGNADEGTIRWLTTPQVKAKLMEIERATNTAQFLLAEPGTSLLGYPFVWSNNVPSTLTDGTGTNLHAMILGNWRELIIAQWGGVDLLVDPYTRAKDATIQVIANSFWDVGVRHAASFTAAQDIDIS